MVIPLGAALDFTVIALFLASVLGGSLIQSISGFGFGIFVISVFPFFLPSPQISVAISVMLSLGMTLPMAIRMRKKIVWRHAVSYTHLLSFSPKRIRRLALS